MPTDVVMPQMGESIFEGTITRWLKKVGDSVEKDEPLFEISTDKVDAEIPSPVAGVLSEIKIGEGSTVEINTIVAVVNESGEASVQLASSESTESPAPATAAAKSPQATGQAVSGDIEVVMPQMGESIFEGTITKWLKQVGDSVQKDEPLFEISTDKVDAEIPSPVAGVLRAINIPEGATVEINTVVASIAAEGISNMTASTPLAPPKASAPAPAQPADEAPLAESDSKERLRSSPLVRRIARENHLDLRHVSGTGSAGRITKDDVTRFLEQRGQRKSPPPPAPKPTPVSSTLPGQTVPLSRMRSIIADRMVESAFTAPHVYVVYKIDMTRIARLRERERSRFEQHYGAKLTYMPFIAAAAIAALRAHPVVNASLLKPSGQPGSIQYHANVNLGIAVALDWGLIVPVVKQAESMSFAALAHSMADLAERARGKKLKPEEASGSTFTLTNFGVFGGEFGTPIINQPESAILAIGGLKKEAVVLTDEEGNDTIAIRSMQSYCLGFDHRLIDGADAGKFMTTFKNALESWDRSNWDQPLA